jgi:hypothetical protein
MIDGVDPVAEVGRIADRLLDVRVVVPDEAEPRMWTPLVATREP